MKASEWYRIRQITSGTWAGPGNADLHALPLPKGNIEELIAGIEQILDGKIVGREEKTFVGDGLRCDFGSTGTVYRPEGYVEE